MRDGSCATLLMGLSISGIELGEESQILDRDQNENKAKIFTLRTWSLLWTIPLLSLPPTRKRAHPDVVNPRACVRGSAEDPTSYAPRHARVGALRTNVTVCIGTVGKLIMRRCRYRRQPYSVSSPYAPQRLGVVVSPEGAIMSTVGCRNEPF